MTDIARENAQEILHATGEVLKDRGERMEIVVIGGTALILAGLAPESHTTPDVDVIALGRPGQLITADPLPPALVEAAADIRRVFGLRADWLNAGPTRQLDKGLAPDFESGMTTFDYGGLVVRIPSRAALVALKLHAATDSSPANKHEQDLQRMPAIPGSEVLAAADWAGEIRQRRDVRGRIADLVERLTKSK